MNRFTAFLARFVALAIAVFTSSANAEFRPQVINGSDATPGAWSFMVALLNKQASSSADGQFCGGSLIGPQHILTAAHCVVSYGAAADPREIVVKIGGGNLTFSPLNGLEVLGVIPHPGYDSETLSNDLAILKLKEAVTNTPINLALSADTDLYAEGTSATLLGYGNTDPKLPISPFVLQQAQIPIASDQTCMNEIGRLFNPETHMCAGIKASSPTAGDGIGSCYGDSGGPLFVSDGTGAYKQVGVVSWGLGCAHEKTRGVYSKIIANEAFVTSFPMAKPIADGQPTVERPDSLQQGSVLRCAPPSLYGDTPAQIKYRWYPESRSGLIEVTTNADTYTLRGDEIRVMCSVEASNSGGSTGEVSSRQVELPFGISPPTDTTLPNGTITDLSCSKKRCELRADAADDLSGVVSVTAVVRLSYVASTSEKKSEKVSKKTSITRTIRAKKISDVAWRGQFRLVPGVRQRVKVKLVVRDLAGNVNPVADLKATTALGE